MSTCTCRLISTGAYPDTAIEVGSSTARINWTIQSNFHHAAGSLHGSVYFKLLDDAAFFAVQSEVTDVFVVTYSFNIQLIRPVKEGEIVAEGKVRFRSRELFTAESTLYDQRGREIAFGTGNFAKSRNTLDSIEGYRERQ